MRLHCASERHALTRVYLAHRWVKNLRGRVELLLGRRRIKLWRVLWCVLGWWVRLIWMADRSLIKWIPTWGSLIKWRYLMRTHERIMLSRLNTMSLRNSFIFEPFSANYHTFIINFILFFWLWFKPRLWTLNLISIFALILFTVIFLELNQQLECLLDFFNFFHDFILRFLWLSAELIKSCLEIF